MIVLKILLLFLFCDNLIHIKAQLNKCNTSEGNEGFCMNIWECSYQVKYLFSGIQNSMHTFNILKSVCDYTNSTIKLCCPSSSNTEDSSSLQQNKTNCNDNNKNIDDNSSDEIITKASDLSENLELKLNEHENKTEPIFKKNVVPNYGPIQENSETLMSKDESEDLPEYSNINFKTDSSELNDNNINFYDSSSELYTPEIENIEVFEPYHYKQNFIQEMDDYDLDSVDTPEGNISVEFKISMNSDNQIKNNTFIIINISDKDTIFDKNTNSIESLIPEDKIDTTANSSTNKCDKINIELIKKILCVMFGKNFSLAAFPPDISDESLENIISDMIANTETIDTSANTEIFDAGANAEYVSFERASETSTSLENVNSSELSSFEIPSENIYSSENRVFQESLEIMYSSESSSSENQKRSENQMLSSENHMDSSENQMKSSENQTKSSENQTKSSENQMKSSENQMKSSEDQIENSSENSADDFNFFTSNESDEVYVSLPNPPHCGKNRKSKKGEFSWQVLLKEKDKKNTKDFCRGTLITRQHIVTTAYCIRSREIESVLIRSQKISAYITLKIQDIKVHENFEPHHIQNDIALIKLFEPIELEEFSPICLKVDFNLSKNLTGIVAYSTGYGKHTSKPRPKAQKLISRYECLHELDDIENILNINENILCTKSKPSTEDVCLGNEGSPLVIRGKSNGQIYYYQIGIASEVNSCDTLNHLGIFVNINLYLNWLLKNM